MNSRSATMIDDREADDLGSGVRGSTFVSWANNQLYVTGSVPKLSLQDTDSHAHFYGAVSASSSHPLWPTRIQTADVVRYFRGSCRPSMDVCPSVG